MAVADPVSGPASSLPVSNKLQSKLNLLKELIGRKKSEVRRIGGEMRSLITKKENEIIKELDGIWDEVNSRVDRRKADILKKIGTIETHNKEITKKYEEMKNLFKEMNQTLPPLPQISEAVESAKREFDISIPSLNLSWRSDVVRESIDGMCIVEQGLGGNAPFQLKWSKCEEGRGETQLGCPCGIAINSVNGIVYVTDYNKQRVQIFSKEGEWIRTLKDENILSPKNIIIQNESIYILCNKTVLIFNLTDEKLKQSSRFFDISLRGICADKSHVYVCTYTGMDLIFFTQALKEEKQITLNPQLCESTSYLRDMFLAQNEFYVLLSNTEYPVQAFSMEGLHTRCVVQKHCVKDAWYFCVDQQLNLIISDMGDSRVKIFSNDGELLNQISRLEGEFTELAGVSVDELGRVILVDRSQHHMLQAYSPFM